MSVYRPIFNDRWRVLAGDWCKVL